MPRNRSVAVLSGTAGVNHLGGDQQVAEGLRLTAHRDIHSHFPNAGTTLGDGKVVTGATTYTAVTDRGALSVTLSEFAEPVASPVQLLNRSPPVDPGTSRTCVPTL